ncbi:MAG: YdiU family protein [Pseudomonadota bacterium]|nr:YdiU family protein [Pseudomonadota bacterium]
MKLAFDNRFTACLPQDPNLLNQRREVQGALWSAVMPAKVAAPRLIAASPDMLNILGLSTDVAQSREFAEVFAGNRLEPGMQPHASNYGGHQFGSWAGQLGDGRAITLGEVRAADGQHWALQLKGAGETPYSRMGDGRAVLRSSIREFLCSEAMHHLGIPTTRALSLIATGEAVLRDMFYDGHVRAEPGAIVCRAAPSFLRFGHFELPASRGDTGLLRQLLEFCIRQDFPHLAGGDDRYAAWFMEVAGRTAKLIAEWMRVGFVHGVMNTDNMSITGLSIDYGPYGWLDDYNPDFTPNTSDRQGRYRYGYQPRIALWNLQQLAVAIAPLLPDPAPLLNAGLQHYAQTYVQAERDNACRKLGLPQGAPQALPLMRHLQGWLRAAEVDMTLFFRALGDSPAEELHLETFAESFYSPEKRKAHADALQAWLSDYRAALAESGQSETQRQDTCRAANPRFILRNWLVQAAIEQAEAGDESHIHTLLALLRNPYQEQTGDTRYIARCPDSARFKPGCAMLSCSS